MLKNTNKINGLACPTGGYCTPQITPHKPPFRGVWGLGANNPRKLGIMLLGAICAYMGKFTILKFCYNLLTQIKV